MKMILTKLMAINKVARSCWGFSNRWLTAFSDAPSLSLKLALCSAFNEKKATSEPASKAESSNKMIKIKDNI